MMCCMARNVNSVPGTLFSGKAPGAAAGGRITLGSAWTSGKKGSPGYLKWWAQGLATGLTLAWGCEAHSLSKGSQHRLLCQTEAQPSTQGSGKRANNGQWACPHLSNLALYT